eukprot:2756384-Amphidinium_carterae.1
MVPDTMRSQLCWLHLQHSPESMVMQQSTRVTVPLSNGKSVAGALLVSKPGDAMGNMIWSLVACKSQLQLNAWKRNRLRYTSRSHRGQEVV